MNKAYRAHPLILGAIHLLSALLFIGSAPDIELQHAAVAGGVAWLANGVAWRVFWSTRLLIYTDDAVRVVNPWREYEFFLQDIAGITVGDQLAVRLQDRSLIRVWCVQRANLAKIPHRRSHADRVVGELRAMRDAARADGLGQAGMLGRLWRPSVVAVTVLASGGGVWGAAMYSLLRG